MAVRVRIVRRASADSSSEEGRHDRGDDRDVPAGDRDDVAHPGRRERRREVPVDPVAEADEDAGREPGLRLRKRPGQRLPAGPSKSLDRVQRAARRRRPARASGP